MKEAAQDQSKTQTVDPFKPTFDYTHDERIALTKLYEETFTPIHEHEVVKSKVIDIHKRDVIISIGGKSDGIINVDEFRDIPDLKPGDEVEVYIDQQENAQGQLVLSRRKAKLMKAWEMIQNAADNGESLTALVKRKTKGGLIVDVQGIEAFLPGSQVDLKPARNFDAWVGTTIDVGVVKINYANDNVIVSRKALLEKSLAGQKQSILSSLEKGQILEGIVKNMTNFGVFIDLGGLDALLHITDITWHRIKHPSDILSLDQKVKVVVTGFDKEQNRISLGMKQLTPHPWEIVSKNLQVGTRVKGKVVNIADYGAFLEISPGVEGLIHISEMTWSPYPKRIRDMLQIGEKIEVLITTLDQKAQKMSLSLKQLTIDPWIHEGLNQKYAAGTKHTGKVSHIVHAGAWVNLAENIDGFLQISDLSWGKRLIHPSDLIQVGDKLELIVLSINLAQKKISLGLKQLQENPWPSYQKTFQVNSIHPGTIIKKIDKGAVVALTHDLEGFVPRSHLIKKDGHEAMIHEKLDFQVVEFANQKIILSHTNTLKK